MERFKLKIPNIYMITDKLRDSSIFHIHNILTTNITFLLIKYDKIQILAVILHMNLPYGESSGILISHERE